MIQRKQTVYLALAFICMMLLFVFPVFTVEGSSGDFSVKGEFGANGLTLDGESAAIPLYIIFVILGLLTGAGIALYKNRKRQLMISRINLILHILFVFALAAFYYVGQNIAQDQLAQRGDVEVAFSMDIGFFLAVATVPFIILAIRGIKQDEELLKSIDRIR